LILTSEEKENKIIFKMKPMDKVIEGEDTLKPIFEKYSLFKYLKVSLIIIM
jgi:hypothetical protein